MGLIFNCANTFVWLHACQHVLTCIGLFFLLLFFSLPICTGWLALLLNTNYTQPFSITSLKKYTLSARTHVSFTVLSMSLLFFALPSLFLHSFSPSLSHCLPIKLSLNNPSHPLSSFFSLHHFPHLHLPPLNTNPGSFSSNIPFKSYVPMCSF